MSKIGIIMEGNPYNATPGHLTQIKRKLLLIDILENKWLSSEKYNISKLSVILDQLEIF